MLSSNDKADALLSKLCFWSFPEQHKRAVSIFLLNRIEGEKNDEAHLYLKLSLINHSCDPNSTWNSSDLDGKTVELRAIKEIEANEEVTASYLDSGKATFGERKEKEQSRNKKIAMLPTETNDEDNTQEPKSNMRIFKQVLSPPLFEY